MHESNKSVYRQVYIVHLACMHSEYTPPFLRVYAFLLNPIQPLFDLSVPSKSDNIISILD